MDAVKSSASRASKSLNNKLKQIDDRADSVVESIELVVKAVEAERQAERTEAIIYAAKLFASPQALAELKTVTDQTNDIGLLRDQIDLIDEALVSLLDSRMAVAEMIGKAKKATQTHVYDENRERVVMERALTYGNHSYAGIFSAIMSKSKSLQKEKG